MHQKKLDFVQVNSFDTFFLPESAKGLRELFDQMLEELPQKEEQR